MKAFKFLLVAAFVFIPSYAFAWGPLTHIYLGSEIFYLGSVLPAGIYGLLRKYRQDYLYGNLTADIVLAKKYLPKSRHSHSWDVAMRLFESARTEPEKAFAYGYMSHLAADTVAHGRFTSGKRNLGHAFLELRADSIIDRKHWLQAVSIGRDVQRRNDIFLERSLDRVIFSFKTNKRIFKSWVLLSGLNREKVGDFMDMNPMLALPSRGRIEGYHEESLDRMTDVLVNGARSEVLKKDPIGHMARGKILSVILK